MVAISSLCSGTVVQVLPSIFGDETKELVVVARSGNSAILSDATIITHCQGDEPLVIMTGEVVRLFSITNEAHLKMHAVGFYYPGEFGTINSKRIFASESIEHKVRSESLRICVSHGVDSDVVFLDVEFAGQRLSLTQGDHLFVDGEIVLTYHSSQLPSHWQNAAAVVHLY